MSLEEYVGKWWNLFDKPILADILNSLNRQYCSPNINILPDRHDIFKAFHKCKYDDCKVVMIGMSPYEQKGVATGILFANYIYNKNLSPSLKVIMGASGSNDITLESWCNQGVLMLNSALSVQEGKPSSHLLLWRPFITSFLKNLSQCQSGLVYVLFGSDARDLISYININLNDVLIERHPAYYARQNQEMPSNVFNEINKLLINKYNQSIKW